MKSNTTEQRFQERRKYPRIKGDFTIEIAHKKARIMGNAINLSASGMYFQCNKEIPLFTEIETVLQLPGEKEPIVCTGVVVRSEEAPQKGRYNIAIFFSDLLPEEKQKIADYVNRKLQEQKKY